MSRRIRIEPEAQVELQAAGLWYEAQQPGLGQELLDEAERVYARIAEGDSGTPVPGAETEARRLPIPRFPLWVVFLEHDREVLIVAFAHERRRPGYWHRR